MRLIQCASCSAQNRIQGFSYSRLYICGKCQTPLPVPASNRPVQFLVKNKYWLVLVVIVGGSVILDQLKSSPRSVAASGAMTGYTPPVSQVPAYPTVPVNQGVYQKFTTAESIAPFRIVTPSGPENYYVKLVDAFTGAPTMSFFIFGGQRFEIEVPLGTYRVKYATGSTWYGDIHLFGQSTHYSAADKVFEFTAQGNQLSGYTVELIRQRSGNLHTKSISASQF